MIITPLQYFGIGDVMFSISIARQWIAEGHTVIWGVMRQYVDDLNRAYPDITFVDYKTLPIDYNGQDEHDQYLPDGNFYRVVPLRWSVEICKVAYRDCMKSKYQMFGLDWQNWKDNAMFTRDREREQQLYDLVVKEKPYKVINRFFRSTNTGKVQIPAQGIEMPLQGYSLFDWAKVLEEADEIHTVSTSIIYMLELLQLNAKKVYIYKRFPDEKNHDNYSYILQSHNYVLV